jgi:ribosomal protein S18 acetylase RimI-like enzyme
MIDIRPAQPQESMAIYAIKSEAFSNTSLPYSIYQSPRSVHYLEHLITQAPDPVGHNIWVAYDGSRIVGYYHAVKMIGDFFLNYIAVDLHAQRRGVGSALLQHFESLGKEYGAQQLVLDVFERSPQVVSWYENCGYHLQSSSFHVCLSLDSSIGQASAPLGLTCDEKLEQAALDLEQKWGFSKIDYACGTGTLSVGLIADRACKLLKYEQVEIEQAVLAICNRYRNTRQVLIVSSLAELPKHWKILCADQAFRLVKPVFYREKQIDEEFDIQSRK